MASSDPAVTPSRDRPGQLQLVVTPSGPGAPDRRPPVAVGPGRVGRMGQMAIGTMRDGVTGYPIQYAKVQAPVLRDETLARHRLLDRLHVKIHSRVILILADAGYGKTTLLADFARRTRLRTLWYRLDVDDLDWTTMLHHLVAAGREHLPDFAPATLSMLGESGINMPTREAVLDVFIRELSTIAPAGAVLILDDFHLVDESPDARFIARELVARAPERLSIVFASRRSPTVPLARLRAIGEVTELGTDDLRFDATETERLFSETFGRTLEPDVLAVVTARTEGWAASLQLVQAALRDRSPAEIRRFVRGLSGADQELYDYLAEEVVGDLPEDLQLFLMQTSILQVVTPDLAGVVTDLDAADAVRLTTAAERLTLLGRRAGGPRTQLRYHPLVREFLEARLDREAGAGAVRALHERVGRYAEGLDWRIAAHHFSRAGDRARAHRVIDDAAKDIIAKGEYSLTEAYITDDVSEVDYASFHVLRSRRDFKRGDVAGAMAQARRAVSIEPRSSIAIVNLASLAFNVGDLDLAVELSRQLAEGADDPGMRAIAEAYVALIESSVDGSVRDLVDLLRALADRQQQAGDTHFEGITRLNLANALRAMGDPEASLEAATRSIELLESSSAGSEVAVSHLARAATLSVSAGIEVATQDIGRALHETNPVVRTDILGELSDIEVWFGSAERAGDHLAELTSMGDSARWARPLTDVTRAQLALRLERFEEARLLLESASPEQPTIATAQKARLLATTAHWHVAYGSPTAAAAIATAADQARKQGSRFWLAYAQMLDAMAGDQDVLRRFVRTSGRDGMTALSMAAELGVSRLDDLGDAEMQVVLEEARRRPIRWLDPLRRTVDGGERGQLPAAQVLEVLGTKDDVSRLRSVAKGYRGGPLSTLGKGLARRVAPRVFIEDQGRISILIGTSQIDGTSIRRKVLGLLCFLASRPRFSAAREEVLDGLWPDFDPADALNSLNQTVYFLRRVFEPAFQEDLSPGYLNHESDVVWLDSGLIQSRSRQCWELIQALPTEPSASDVAELSSAYIGPFALDFAYEEWATSYRATLQSSYLQVIEKAVRSDTESGHFSRGIQLARRALEACPDADNVELSLLRLYKLSGSHAAAAEQYAHYSTWHREALGAEPPPLESL